MVRSEEAGLPVVDADEIRLVGWLSHRDVLRVYHAHSSSAARGPDGGTPGG
jgi:CBS domain-containing protein